MANVLAHQKELCKRVQMSKLQQLIEVTESAITILALSIIVVLSHEQSETLSDQSLAVTKFRFPQFVVGILRKMLHVTSRYSEVRL